MKQDLTTVMTSNPTWISNNASIKEAIDLINVSKLSHLLVRDNETLIGVISRNDLLEKFYELSSLSSGKMYNNLELNNTKIETLIKQAPITVKKKSSCYEAMSLMITNKIHCIPVLNDEGEAIGIVTPSDIMYALHQEMV